MAVFLNVKNTFNSLPWTVMFGKIDRKAMPPYMVRVVTLKDRMITSEGVILPDDT